MLHNVLDLEMVVLGEARINELDQETREHPSANPPYLKVNSVKVHQLSITKKRE